MGGVDGHDQGVDLQAHPRDRDVQGHHVRPVEVQATAAVPAIHEGVGDPAEVGVLPADLHLGVRLHVAADEPADGLAVDKGQVRTVEHVLHGPGPMAVPGPLDDDPGQCGVGQGLRHDGLAGRVARRVRVDPDEIADRPGRQGRGAQGLKPRLRVQGDAPVGPVRPEPPAVEGTLQASLRRQAAQGQPHTPVRAAVDQDAGLALRPQEDRQPFARQLDPHRSPRKAAQGNEGRPDPGEALEHQSSPRALRASARAFTRPMEPRK